MTMPSSGAISFSQANTELTRSSTATLTMNDSGLRTLAAVGGSGTSWSFSSLYGKSNFAVGLTGGSTTYEDNDGNLSAIVTMTAKTNGQLTIISTTDNITKRWGSPDVTGIGSGYWVKFTLTTSSQSGTGTGTQTATTAWLQLSSDRAVTVNANKTGAIGTRIVSGTYTVQIATDSGGSNIVATATGYVLRAVGTST